MTWGCATCQGPWSAEPVLCDRLLLAHPKALVVQLHALQEKEPCEHVLTRVIPAYWLHIIGIMCRCSQCVHSVPPKFYVTVQVPIFSNPKIDTHTNKQWNGAVPTLPCAFRDLVLGCYGSKKSLQKELCEFHFQWAEPRRHSETAVEYGSHKQGKSMWDCIQTRPGWGIQENHWMPCKNSSEKTRMTRVKVWRSLLYDEVSWGTSTMV